MQLTVNVHGQAVDYGARVFEGVAGAHEKAVDNTTTSIEVIVDAHKSATDGLADLMCSITQKC